jgi:hypothetical protein
VGSQPCCLCSRWIAISTAWPQASSGKCRSDFHIRHTPPRLSYPAPPCLIPLAVDRQTHHLVPRPALPLSPCLPLRRPSLPPQPAVSGTPETAQLARRVSQPATPPAPAPHTIHNSTPSETWSSPHTHYTEAVVMDKQRTHEQRAIEQLEALGWELPGWQIVGSSAGSTSVEVRSWPLISISTRRRSRGTGSTIPGETCSSTARAIYPHRT